MVWGNQSLRLYRRGQAGNPKCAIQSLEFLKGICFQDADT
jgi:hypothetical protein